MAQRDLPLNGLSDAVTLHLLKTWPTQFVATKVGVKRFEYRRDDRGFSIGDHLVLLEWDPRSGTYTGQWLVRVVTYILGRRDLAVTFGVPLGFVVMSLRKPRRTDACEHFCLSGFWVAQGEQGEQTASMTRWCDRCGLKHKHHIPAK